MKKRLLFLLTTIILSFSAAAQMVLEFNTNLSTGTTITLPLNGTVNVTVDWGDGTIDTYTTEGNQEHTYAADGNYTVSIDGTLTWFGRSNYPDADKLTTVISFGNTGLTSLSYAFHMAVNLVQVPTQLPSTVWNLQAAFQGASSFNSDISGWDVSNVTNMNALFFEAASFNQDISNWDVSSVDDMQNMFYEASAFNQNISTWNVSNVTTVSGMFFGASSFNQNIGSWALGNVLNMSYMFHDALSFNQDIGSWDVSNVTNMLYMFYGVTLSTDNYDNLLKGWALQTVTNDINFHGGNSKYTPGEAADARAVLTDTYGWVITDGGMVAVPTVYTIDVTDITKTTAISSGNVTNNGGIPVTARGVVWGASINPTTDTHLGITSDGDGVGTFASNITGLTENTTYYVRAYATNASGTAYGENMEFTTKAPMLLEYNTSLSTGTTITLPLNGTVNVTVDWGDGTSDIYTTEGNQEHTYATEGTYTVSIDGTLTEFGRFNCPNADKLITVVSFGNTGLTSLLYAFHGAINLEQVPTQLPSTVWKLQAAFRGASNFNSDIGSWDVSGVTNMKFLFNDATSFNQDISSWDVSSVYDMQSMFSEASSFNQDISNWDVSNVSSMLSMFSGASSFNQDISSWDVSNVTEMQSLFSESLSFNQDISSWDVSNVTDMSDMFYGATLSTNNYDNLLMGWAGQTVTNDVNFHGGNSKYTAGAAGDARAVLTDTYGWVITDGGAANILVLSTLAPTEITSTTAISGGNIIYNGGSPVTARGVVWGVTENPTTDTHLGITSDGDGVGTFASNITGLTENTTYYVRAYATNVNGTAYGENMEFTTKAPMLLEYNTSLSTGTTITLPLYGTVNATVDWGDGTSDTYTTEGNQDHTYAAEGTYTVSIDGTLTEFGAFNYPNADKLITVVSFGNTGLTSLVYAFHEAVNLGQVPIQLPSTVWNLQAAFRGASSFNFDIGSWDVSGVTNMKVLFAGATSFNQNISTWDVSNVSSMLSMFSGASSFNQDISSWDVSNVTEMQSLFSEALSFNQDISSWDVSNVTDMTDMFNGVMLSLNNYNSLLIGWAGQTVTNDVNFHGGNSKYTAGEAGDARAVLTDTYGWIITDGGVVNNPVVLTLDVEDITTTTASSGGDVTNNGGSPVTARGVVWGSSENPTIDTHLGITTDGDGVGTFASSITGLTENTTYFVRAYATNANGTAYGDNMEFTAQKTALAVSGTFTASSKVYDGSTVANIDVNNLLLDGINPGFSDVIISSVDLVFNDKNVADNKIVSISSIEISGDDANQYYLELAGAPEAQANITAKELTIGGDFIVADKEYDGTTAAIITENNLTLIAPIDGDDISFDVAAEFETADVGENIMVSISAAELNGVDAENYLLSLTGSPTTTASISAGISTFTVAFTVTDNVEPLEGATISIGEQAQITNIDGIAIIELENGVYPYSVIASGYIAYEGSVTVDGSAVSVEVSLIPVGINEGLLANINVYPNPFQNTINISNAGNANRLVITNIIGKVAMVVDLRQSASSVVETNLPSGIYMVTVFANDGSTVTKRLIRE